MRVIAVLPAFNAATTLHKTIEAIPRDVVDEIILVDDASSDNTAEIAQSIEGVTVYAHEENRGYGGNQKTCYDKALDKGADIVVMIHPDFQYDPRLVPELIAPLEKGEADFVMGSRFIEADPRLGGMSWWRYLGNRFLTTSQNLALQTNLSECHSGYRAYSSSFLRSVPYQTFSNHFVFDAQMIVAAVRRGSIIKEVPIPTRYDPESSSASLPQSIQYGFSTLMTLVPERDSLKSKRPEQSVDNTKQYK